MVKPPYQDVIHLDPHLDLSWDGYLFCIFFDHSILELSLNINTFQCGKGLWKFNCSLLKNENYLELVNKAIKDIKMEYAVPVYSYEYINSDQEFNLQFTIIDHLLLEMLLMKIRETTITFSSSQKKIETTLEKNLLKEIDILENSDASHNAPDILQTKKEELLRLLKKNLWDILFDLE